MPCQWGSFSGGSGFSGFLHSLFRRNDEVKGWEWRGGGMGVAE
ncbi:MAG: hypothetical protein OXU61_04035 [Gammaproteobacteria bacterium]|nr:hypothetical protein [Gammaproteobacteria bacterium]